MIRATLVLVAALTLAVPSVGVAQPAATLPRIGVLQPGTPAAAAHLFDALKQALRELGYVAGQQIAFEHRFGGFTPEQMSAAAAESIRLKVTLIVASTDVGIAATKQQTATIPIVMVAASDPVETGFVASLARPGANVTGLTAQALIVMSPSPIAFANRTRIASFARTARLPSMYGNREFVDAGGLMAYGASPESQFRAPPPTSSESCKAPSPASCRSSSPPRSSSRSTSRPPVHWG